jgi:hypothetical protein
LFVLSTHEATIDPHGQGAIGYRQAPPITLAAIDEGKALLPECLCHAFGHMQHVVSNGDVVELLVDSYLPFENAGAVSAWHFELPSANNEIDLSAVSDLVLHLYYTALDGGDALKTAAQAESAANLPAAGIKVLSAASDFGAPAASAANPYPVTPWQAFLATPAPGADQVLALSISPARFPAWTRGKTLTVSEIAVVSLGWTPGNLLLQPQAPLPGAWSFKLRREAAADFRSLTSSGIGDLLLFVSFQVS